MFPLSSLPPSLPPSLPLPLPLSLSLSDGLCRGQTESPAAGRLQTIVLIPLFCSLPTHLTNTNIYTAPHLLSPQGCRDKHTELQMREKWGKRKRFLTCALTHHGWQTTHTHTHTHTNSFIKRAAFTLSSRLSLYLKVFPLPFSLSLFYTLWSSTFHLPLFPLTFFQASRL